MNDKYRKHSVLREDRADGSILLLSAYELSPVANRTTDWLVDWAARTPDALFIAERDGAGWRSYSYAQTLAAVQAIAAALLDRGMSEKTPILIISGNGVDHGLLTLAAQYIGVPTVPVAEQYSLIPAARAQLSYVAGLIKPAMVFANDGAKFADGLAMPEFDKVQKLVSVNGGAGHIAFADLLAGGKGDIAAANAKVGPDTVAKILLTSGSTSSPKGVLTTHRMMCANQAQIADAMPFLRTHPPVIVDWLPWNHVFGGSHNFNMMLANGGSLYVDGGKPVKGLIDTTIENNRMVSPTLAFNVPVGFSMLRDAMRTDEALRKSYFQNLDMLFYAGASLPQDIWRDLEDMAREMRGDVPLMTSSWGLTETAPACLIQHEPTTMSGIVGVPMTGTTIKLIPDDTNRYEVRVTGPNIMPGYYQNPEKTAEAFDAEGYFITGDAMGFVDPADINKGMRFDGRISDDFKLMTGTWVRAAAIRLELLGHLTPMVMDVVLTGADKNEVGAMVFLAGDFQAAHMGTGAVEDAALRAEFTKRFGAYNEGKPSSARINRVLVLAEPPSIGDGEITAKGNLNYRKVLTRRGDLLEQLYNDAPCVIKL